MVDQAPLTNRNEVSESPPRAAARNVSELMHDIMLLAELQGQLAMVEFRQELKKLIPPLAILVGGLVLALSCLPLALVCIALVLDEWTDLSRPVAFLITLGGGALLAVATVLGSVFYMRSSIGLMGRTRTEFSLNLRWVRKMLKRLGTANKRNHLGAEAGHS